MTKKTEKNVISYRVRDFDNDHFVIETYSMKLADELAFYKDSKVNYYIRYNSYVKRKQSFLEYINKKCRDLNYGYYQIKDSIEELNIFLAMHYFTHGSFENSEEIRDLNTLACEYIAKYNSNIHNSIDTYDNHGDVDNRLTRAQLFFQKEITHIECVNVAQANFTIGYAENTESPLAVFDIGIKSSTTGSRAYAQNKLKQLNGKGIVVVSHYDYDHINGYRYLSNSALDRIWILPKRRLAPTPTERNLLSLLKPNNCIFLDDVDYSQTPFNPALHVLEIGNISIYRGNAKKIDSNQSTDENARCLMCLVKNRTSILLPADCLYEEYPTDFNVDYLVVPHHCCYYDKPIKNMVLPALKELIVFAGPHSGYMHPDISHINRLNQGGCQVIYLMNHGRYYFNHKNQIFAPAITLAFPSHIVTL